MTLLEQTHREAREKRQQRLWTFGEDATLRSMWTERSIKEIANQLRRTGPSVKDRAKRIGLERLKEAAFVWSDEATERLRALYHDTELTLTAIAQKVGAPSAVAVTNKANHLGLAPRVRYIKLVQSANDDVDRVRVDPALFDARNQRLAAPYRSLSAAFFGDPPIGYSALERRR
jgi:hypothetical protein